MNLTETQKNILLLNSLKNPRKIAIENGYSSQQYRELLFSRADEPDFVQEQVWREISEAAKEIEIGRQLITLFSARDNQLEIVVNPAEGAVAPTIAEGGEFPKKTELFRKVTIVCFKFGDRPEISAEMIEDGLFDSVGNQLRLAGRRVALREDNIIMTALRFNTTEATFTVADSSLTNNIDTTGTFTDNNMSDAIETIEVAGFDPDVGALRPELMADIRVEAAFADQSQWNTGGNMLKSTGKVSNLFGIEVTMTRHGLSGTADEIAGLILDKSVAGAYVLRRDTTINNFEDPIRDVVGMVVSKRSNAGLLNEDSICSIQR